jgi:hypothetical protein
MLDSAFSNNACASSRSSFVKTDASAGVLSTSEKHAATELYTDRLTRGFQRRTNNIEAVSPHIDSAIHPIFDKSCVQLGKSTSTPLDWYMITSILLPPQLQREIGEHLQHQFVDSIRQMLGLLRQLLEENLRTKFKTMSRNSET